ncbi:hypothetical protein DFQ30_010222 [Apophysomyces sp. BC1015]|nr:hypothetical protein DFQ30_010222 [Apophysomyces sp. BC1015]
MNKRIIEASGVVKATIVACATVAAIGTVHAADAANGPSMDGPANSDYPKLAGQYADYLYWALRQYQMGGGNPSFGRDNTLMATQVQSLSESDLKDIAAYIESLKGDLVLKK